MRTLFSLIFLLASLALGACSPGADSTIYTPPDNPRGQLCVAHCSEIHNVCRGDCGLKQRECLNRVQGQALIEYETYMSDQFLHNDAIKYRLSDFERLQPCEDEFMSCTLGCEAPYQMCYEKCGGEVKNTTACGFLCF